MALVLIQAISIIMVLDNAAFLIQPAVGVWSTLRTKTGDACLHCHWRAYRGGIWIILWQLPYPAPACTVTTLLAMAFCEHLVV